MRSANTRIGVAGAALVLLLAACGGSDSVETTIDGAPPTSAATVADPAAVPTGQPLAPSDFPHVTALGPSTTNAGEVPTFSWDPAPEAATYHLVVLGPELPLWAWQGTDSEVTFGLPERLADPNSGPQIAAGSCWSVIALDADGTAIAASDLIPVSPGESNHECSPGAG